MKEESLRGAVSYWTNTPDKIPPISFMGEIPLFRRPERLQDFRYSVLWATYADESKTIPADQGEDPVWGQLAAELVARLAGGQRILSLLTNDPSCRPTAPNVPEANDCPKVPGIGRSIREELSGRDPWGELRCPMWLSDSPPLSIPEFHLRVRMSLCPVAEAYASVRQHLVAYGLNGLSAADLSKFEFILCCDFAGPFDDEAAIVLVHRPVMSNRLAQIVRTVVEMFSLRLET